MAICRVAALYKPAHLEEGNIEADCHSVKWVQWNQETCTWLRQYMS